MCLAVPMEVVKVCGEQAECCLDGVMRTVSLAMVDEVVVGDYLLIHAGFAIEKLDADEAHKTIDLLRRLVAADEGRA